MQKKYTVVQSIFNHPGVRVEDAIMWRTRNIMEAAADAPTEAAKAKTQVLQLLAKIKNEILQQTYLEQICKNYQWKLTETKKQFQTIAHQSLPTTSFTNSAEFIETEINDPEKLPKWAQPYFSQWKKEGYMAVDTVVNGEKKCGFYNLSVKYNDDSTPIYNLLELTNFIAVPLLHVYEGANSNFIFKIKNHNKQPIIEVPAASMPNPELFQKHCVGEGAFMMFCNTQQWKRVAVNLLDKFIKATPLNYLGWQPDGFFAFVNGIYTPKKEFTNTDDNGTVKHNDTHYFIPAASQIYLQLNNKAADAYIMDRPLQYTAAKTTPSFNEWSSLMHTVYGEKAYLGIASIAMALFKDLIFSIDNNCPLIHCFGEPGSGKSKFAESLNNVFFTKKSALAINTVTLHAFFNYMGRFANTICWINEVDEHTLKPEYFQALKGAFDGEARERGKIVNNKLKTEIQQINGFLFLTGQKIITADDNSLVSRCLIEAFSRVEERTQAQTDAFNKLKQYEEEGMQHLIIELLQHRKHWEKTYKQNISDFLYLCRMELPKVRRANQRIVLNWAHVFITYAMLEELGYQLPVSAEVVKEYCIAKAIYWSNQITNSDILSEWWATIQNLVNNGKLKEGWDYKLELESTLQIEGKEKITEPTKVLYIRLGNCHPMYEADIRQRGKQPISKENILQYMSSRSYYFGKKEAVRFRKYEPKINNSNNSISTTMGKTETVTNAYSFRYEDLNIDIDNTPAQQEELPFTPPTPIKN